MNAAAIKRLVQLAEHNEFVSVYSPHLASLCRLALAARDFSDAHAAGLGVHMMQQWADRLDAALSAVFNEETTR